MRTNVLALPLLALVAPGMARAAQPPCTPCAGVAVADPYGLLPTLGGVPKLEPDARLYVAWELPLDASATPAAAHALAAAGATPWVRLVFRTAPPLIEHVEALQAELDAAAAVASSRVPGAHYELVWSPPAGATGGSPPSAVEYAFLVKRAAVVLTGADPDASVVSAPLPAEPDWLRAFYGQEVAAYLDGVAFTAPPAGAPGLAEALAAVVELDPGKPVVIEELPLPAPPEPAERVLAEAARTAAAGFAVAFFRAPGPVTAESLRPFALLANEFRGELSYDPAAGPTGGAEAWSFVRGEDLELRVVAAAPPGAERLALSFADPTLRGASRVQADGSISAPGGTVKPGGLEVGLPRPRAVELLRVARASAADLGGVAERETVESERQIPVEEILRRLQAFEDAQNRRVRHWQAQNATSLRFQAASGVQAVEATFEGEIFLRPGQPFDWEWRNFYINGVRWKGKQIPELPLIQPEKAAAMPLEVLFTKEYRYALRGTDRVAGRDCWVIGFEPAVAVEEGRTLFRGTVWVDREEHARVRTRAVQLGLTGDVLSNEETLEYFPVDAAGAAAAWGAPDAFVLPLRTTGQQLLSVLNTATVVEREVRMTNVVVNGPDFDRRRAAALASDVTMVRDTEQGLRYLTAEGAPEGDRLVKDSFDTDRLFLLGGVFYDDSLDYPLPLAGINYFDLDFLGPEGQLNAFFGGVLAVVNYADPHLLGTKLDAGADLFAFAIETSDQLYRDGEESIGEEVQERPLRASLNLGYPLGSFVKLAARYQLGWSDFGRADDTAEEFVMPEDHTTQTLGLGLQFARAGYRLAIDGARSRRSSWEFWGLPGNPEFDSEHREYTTWEVSAAKNWYLPNFRKLGVELVASGGENLDRFSKYQFGFFGGNRVHGYQIGKVRAEESLAAHVTYGFEIGKLIRLDAVGDAAWATDETSGLDDELLAGLGFQGTFMGPWETIISMDLGVPVAGPDDGFVAYLVFLKLFK